MRKLKYHEQKLLKKTNFFDWKSADTHRETKILRRYMIQNPEDYHKYNKLVGYITKLTSDLRKLPEDDPFRIKMTDDLLEKLYQMGLISTKSNLEVCERISASVFCRRRLAVVLVTRKFCQHLTQAVTFIEQGHVKVGVDVVNNPAYHVTRNMEDHITWSQGSKIREKIAQFTGTTDDFELLGN
ncbi:U3 small nucleolar ribonucleoprotein/40S ribosomal protein S4-like [Theileria orientalis strain Shintoku]|uniref:U3 small nucleolar ribonucleoprotein/40S ribosomal protein S4-like n=1 Tax=Theileria orientalis strain Shintoku TaxID=869250 RepID=J4CDH7_THEOR|nr:U3 small nucleolar ribonucleoprotein/40S ribosomal protein S4-like [Theileria orientalis strain Shintoku]PVC52793.1 U3 small nucleolar ribonucleoprotein/40S ribosomal protein S4-like [Theileria orientalis]BAM41162.1 U3 small nucleolar ribonucleoprotein/40S ribosomal protein S4-like [Theileria orientalis strain Shintoku]|eukprot:XP_009691463.1 U3 small nucleolar ribonucleoprotein/40S ribosomal protein S4-like [Theileria orientalis strain Shintoku]